MGTIKHMSANIEGILRLYRNRKINFIEDDNGRLLSDAEARAEISEMQKKGYKLIKMSNECEGFDPFGGGCPGHNEKL